MADFVVDECFGCKAEIEKAPGNFYCGFCVGEQIEAHNAEVEAFDAYHAFADAIARKG